MYLTEFACHPSFIKCFKFNLFASVRGMHEENYVVWLQEGMKQCMAKLLYIHLKGIRSCKGQKLLLFSLYFVFLVSWLVQSV